MLSEFSGSFNTGYWTRVIPHAYHEKPFILGMVIALSALTMAKGFASSTDTSLADQHSMFAMERYQKSLVALRKSQAMFPDARTAIMTMQMQPFPEMPVTLSLTGWKNNSP
jgi:hypothetical protein